MGSYQRSPREGRSGTLLRQVPHEGWYDRRYLRYRGLPPRLTDRRPSYPRLRCLCRQDYGVQDRQDQPGLQERRRIA